MPKRISFQLYSARNFAEKDGWEPILAHLSASGYTEVEGFGGVYENAEAFRDLLDKYNLTMPTGHFFPVDQLEKNNKKALQTARTLGMRYIYCPYILPENRPKSGAGWKAWGKRLGEVGKAMNDAGYGFGWHNHDFEFRKLPDGSMPHDRIFEGGPLLDWECDLAWIAFAGQNPVKWLKAYGHQVSAIHFKDNAPKGQNLDQHGQADVGKGVLKWDAIFKAVRENTRCVNYVVEHDNPKDYKSFAANSYKFLSKI